MKLKKDMMTHHILVTAFYDWKDLGTPVKPDRCRDNPSCRVLANQGYGNRGFQGPLAYLLKQYALQKHQIKIDFKLLPVTWEAVPSLALQDYDQVIHIGLGVYDQFHKIMIEDGAYNQHKGKDAIGDERDQKINTNHPNILQATPLIKQGIDRVLNGKIPTPFVLVRAQARADNVYLCNATHYRSLQLVAKATHPRLKEAYFLHIPHSEGEDDLPLSQALFSIIKHLIHY